MNDLILAKLIAQKVKDKGGRAYFVGGYVRDYLLKIDNKDIDIEIYGIKENELYNLLKEIAQPIVKGKSFGVYGLSNSNLDIALPRKERKIGNTHRSFEVEVNPFIKPEIACLRRDFTINALMMDILSNEIYDYVGAINDLNNGIIRHIDDKTFIEDPLRVLRAAQFAARFNFIIDDKTKALCSSLDLSNISYERVEEETKKALLKSNKPSIYFNNLKDMQQLSKFYKVIEDLINVKQNPIYHQEGDVYTHTMLAIDNSVKYRDLVSDSYKFMNLALYHDIGKSKTTKLNDKGQYQSLNHEDIGSQMVKDIPYLKDKSMIKYLKDGILNHMQLNILYANSKNDNKYCKFFNRVIAPQDLIYFSLVDKLSQGNRFNDEEIIKELDFLNSKYNLYQERLKLDIVTGEDLIKAGLKPDSSFKLLLKRAEDLRMCNIPKNEALKQILNDRGNIK